MKINPELDGVDHVNVYSQARTVGGRWATNFARTPFTHPIHGEFTSIEGLWYWLSVKDDRLRGLAGFAAKRLGRELRAADWRQDNAFKYDILLGIGAKIRLADATKAVGLADLRRTRSLPLMHYYVYGTKVIDETSRTLWILEPFDKARQT